MATTRKPKQSGSPKDPAKKRKVNRSRPSTKSPQAKPHDGKKGRKSTKSFGEGSKKKGHKKTNLTKAMELNRGVVYLSRLPHGFYEKELRKYCTQFGSVTGVYVPRNDKGNAKGFGFVEFKHPEVAEVVADTMNNYLMFNRLIKAKIVPVEEQKPWIFSNGINAVKAARKRKTDALAVRERVLTPEEEEKYKKRVESRVKRLKDQLQKKGLTYDFTEAS